MEPNLDMMLEAHADIEILNDKMPNKSLLKFEERLRKEILRLRNNGDSIGAWEIETMLDEMADFLKFKTHRIHYQTIAPAADGHTVLVYEATLDKFHCFIYVRSL